jgi:hypothetical protein
MVLAFNGLFDWDAIASDVANDVKIAQDEK